MTDQTPEQTTTEAPTAPAPETTTAPAEALTEAKPYQPRIPTSNEGSGRWAVYDTKLERYATHPDGRVVHDGKPSKADATKLAPNGYRLIEV